MREILFRGKESCEKGKFVEGAYYHQTEFYGHKEFNKRAKVDEHYIITSTDELEDNMMTFSTVFPETIGQYTGLTDKNGKKIFEGDIVKYEKYATEISNNVYVVKYDTELATFIGEKHSRIHVTGFTTFENDSESIEVIGNIHDNPKLLGGED